MRKKKIAILGSTGSIGKSLLKILRRNKANFKITLLTANKNYKLLLKQAKLYDVKQIIITDQKCYKKAKALNNNKSINIENNFESLKKIFPKKIDYVMSSIVGIEGLAPTLKIIKFTKRIAIANKEPIICAWNIIKKELKKFNTEFVPVDSEHFSIWYALKGNHINNVNKVYLTASGGSLLKIPKSNYKNLKISQILKHPNWSMGKKITIDSSNMINKVFEIIEAKKLFNLNYKKLSILIHPKSYLHAIIKFNDGMIKIIAHDTTMEIPIFNSLNGKNLNKAQISKLNLTKLNNLELKKTSLKKFPLLNILSKLPKKDSLFETILVSANDELVKLFLDQKISYTEISKILTKFLSLKEFIKYKKIQPKKIQEIIKLSKYVRFKIGLMSI